MLPGLWGKQRSGDEERGMNNTEALFCHCYCAAEELISHLEIHVNEHFKKYLPRLTIHVAALRDRHTSPHVYVYSHMSVLC